MAETQMEVPVFACELLRDVLIPDLLGEDIVDILYWAGKNLARKFPLLSMDEAVSFFHEAGWGHLQKIQEKRNEYIFELKGPMVERRLQMNAHPCFRLESGFMAEQVQKMKQAVAEAFEEIHKKQMKVLITVRWDKKDPAGI
jgi:predicted hydrocarbon binding protein